MTCQEYQKQLILSDGEERVASEIREHIAGCPDCQRFLHDSEQLRNYLRGVAAGERAPRALRSRAEWMFRCTGRKRWAFSRRWAGIAASVVLLVLAGYGWWRYSEGPSRVARNLSSEFISDYVQYLPGREEIISTSPPEIEKWFRGRVDFPVHVPAVPEADLKDARVCDIAGHKAALLHYRRQTDDALVSLFIAEEPKALERRGQSIAFSASIRGVNSRLWCRRGLAYAVVGPLDEASLERIAETVRQQEP